MKILSHVIAQGSFCSRCGREIPTVTREGHSIPVMVGERIGVIEGLSTGEFAYVIRQEAFDTNQLCQVQQQAAAA